MNNQRSANNNRRPRNNNQQHQHQQHRPRNQQQRHQQNPRHHSQQQVQESQAYGQQQQQQQQSVQNPQYVATDTYNEVSNPGNLHEPSGTNRPPNQGTFETSQYAHATSNRHQSSHVQLQGSHPQQHLDHYQMYAGSPSDEAAENLSGANQCAARRAIDSVYAMPISDHVYYNSFESYNKLMQEQQVSIVGMMSALSTCYYQPVDHVNYPLDPAHPSAGPRHNGIEFGDINNSMDKYEMLSKINNEMFDEIGHNLDFADGSYQNEAQSVQAALSAAHQNQSITSSHPLAQQSAMGRARSSGNENLPSSSSSSYMTRSSEISTAMANQPSDYYEHPNQQQRYNQFAPNQQRYPRFSKSYQFRRPENKNIPRPQDQFMDKIDNSFGPFVPIIKEKPNATVPLNTYAKRDKHNNLYYDHPYSREIEQCQVDEKLLNHRDPIPPSDLNSAPIVMVETLEALKDMCSHIEAQEEFAVDVEHHSYRSYQGLTCLLQISTRTQDFVIDAIKLRSDLHRLNKSFTNPNIVKVFHGADCDILWLQRDFGVYVVNLFDTSRAAKLMKFPYLSLAFLMKHYCNIDPDKSYQLADWRERPIPTPMLQYARSDTHYLLYIHDRLREDLLNKDTPEVGEEMLRSVYQKGKEICLKRYEKPPFSENSHLSVLKKSRTPFNAKQMYAFREMYAWRDRIGRELDESVGYVLPNSMMMRIAEALPREPQGITALVKPVPQILNKYLSDVHAIILKALDVPLDEKTKLITDNSLNADPSLRSIDLDSVSHKQDIAHSAGVQENSLPYLLDERSYYINDINGRTNGYPYYGHNAYANMHQDPSTLYRFVDPSYNKSNELGMMLGGHATIEHFVPPYERYKESTR